MRRRLLIFLVLMTCGIAGAWAEELTKEQALELARQFVTGQQGKRAAAVGSTVAEAGQVSGLYVFNVGTDGGFVVVSNDDQTAPILGYGDSGSIDPDNLPANLRAWLQSYADQIAWVKANGTNVAHRANRTNRTAKSAVAPLVTTQWNQGAPYNNICPEIDGTKVVTGCVATTMAQIMYYHYAHNGFAAIANTALPSYTATTKNKAKQSINLAVDGLDATEFNWANMTTTYTMNYTDAAADAVSKLMLYCGTALQMIYGLNANGGSSAYSEAIPFALKTYFGYDGGIQHCYRQNYSYSAWVDMIYNELVASRPVALGGQSCGGGHSFICDGYDNNDHNGASGDYFHINWGWGGLSDGYFLLSVLDPYEQGAGGSSTLDGFSFGQDAIIGIRPPYAGNADYCLSLEGLRLGGDDASASSKTFTRDNSEQDFTGISLYYIVYDYYYGSNAFDYAVQLVDGSGNVKKTFYEASNKTMGWNDNNNKMFNDGTLTSLTIPAKIDENTYLTDGTYYIKVMSRPHGESNWQECYDGDAYKLTATIDGNSLTIEVPISANVLPTSVTFGPVTGDRMTGHEHTVTATIIGGAGRYNGDVVLRVNNKAIMGTVLNIGAGGTKEVQFSFIPLKAGKDTIALYNSREGGTKLGNTETYIDDVAFTLNNNGSNTSIIKANHNTTTDATLYGRTLYKDGAWNTLCLPFDVSTTSGPLSGDNVTAMVFDGEHSRLDGTTLTLNFNPAPEPIPAGTPFIIKWAKAEGYDAADPATRDIVNPEFTSVTIDNSDEATARKTVTSVDEKVKFKGLYFSHTFMADDMRYLLVGNGNTLFWPLVGAELGAQRAYFQIAEEDQPAPAIYSFDFNFGEETGISLIPAPSPKGEGSNYWYTLDGRKLNSVPTKKGIYIHGGRKVVIK
ncbi:MAG: C10 family peptidase [Prevotella sp.]|nr:C10 family peptidase [Prevotella sp.]